MRSPRSAGRLATRRCGAAVPEPGNAASGRPSQSAPRDLRGSRAQRPGPALRPWAASVEWDWGLRTPSRGLLGAYQLGSEDPSAGRFSLPDCPVAHGEVSAPAIRGRGLMGLRTPNPPRLSLPTSRGPGVKKKFFSCHWDLLGGHFSHPSVSRRSRSPGSRWSAPTLGVLGHRPAAPSALSRRLPRGAEPQPGARLGVLGAPRNPSTYLYSWSPSGARYFASGAAWVSCWRLATGDPECDWGAALGKGDRAESLSPRRVGDGGVSGCPWSALLQGPDRPSGRRRYDVGRFLNGWEVAEIHSVQCVPFSCPRTLHPAC